MGEGWVLDSAEMAFLRFHLTEPLPEAWQFVPTAPGSDAIFQAVKVLADGKVVSAQLPITSFSRIETFFDDEYRVTMAGRLLLDRENA